MPVRTKARPVCDVSRKGGEGQYWRVAGQTSSSSHIPCVSTMRYEARNVETVFFFSFSKKEKRNKKGKRVIQLGMMIDCLHRMKCWCLAALLFILFHCNLPCT